MVGLIFFTGNAAYIGSQYMYDTYSISLRICMLVVVFKFGQTLNKKLQICQNISVQLIKSLRDHTLVSPNLIVSIC